MLGKHTHVEFMKKIESDIKKGKTEPEEEC